MTIKTITNLYAYPIKSTSAIELQQAKVSDTGIDFDRYFVVTDRNGKFITGRTKAKLVLVQSHIRGKQLTISAPNTEALTLDINQFPQQYRPVSVWNDTISAQLTHEKANQWFSRLLNCECYLYFLGAESIRPLANFNNNLSYADGYPLLIISKASLRDLNQRLQHPVSMAHFRPNIVVDGCEPYEEDSWHTIRIGDMSLQIVKPCSRCIFTTVDPLTGVRRSNREPLTTLADYRQAHDGQVYFGQNALALQRGTLRVGDSLEVVRKQTAIQFSQ
ncbi:MOSC domain-containing protein [Thalassotalea ponticola]|uniref:MOSC domain-containing protein n=1 Tax=Thalassotalea ponticola TaxID=1523392 RepID=UPI0025B5CEE6|nr:MOSC N-terminal beta barrel domain-containing protein [Thalassotalea ponticola]MDN3653693.1 MOSC domain-containing protein [Thalassotalea ponticola]